MKIQKKLIFPLFTILVAFAVVVAATLNEKHSNSEYVNAGSISGTSNKTFYVSTVKRDWILARAICEIDGMNFATVVSEEENTLLRDFFEHSEVDRKGEYHWIAGTNIMNLPGFNNLYPFVWTPTNEQITWFKWYSPNFPSTHLWAQCLALRYTIWTQTWESYWMNYDCRNEAYFICHTNY